MKGYYSRERHPSLYQVKVHSLFYLTQLQESVYALKRNYQFLEALHMIMYCHCKLYEVMHSIDFVIKLSALEHPR